MALQVYNSLTRKKEKFEPLTPGQVKMYVCGPTVYNFLHVGNFRGPVFFNFVRNWLESEHHYNVEFALNFTDVDDRIIDRANQEHKSSLEISELYIAEYKKDYQSLGLRPHTYNPKVTEAMEPIKAIVSDLVKKEKAYVVDGEVLYSISAFQGYGKLSGRNPEELIAGARVEVDTKKKNPLDFSLWKPAKPGEPSWESPWGPGRPGWHIECSAMIKNIFGDQIDIHGGGSDLIFPHHENEIAQSEGATGKPFAKYWMHNSMLNFSGMKMSKSVGNVVRLRDFVAEYNAEIYKYMILSVHYRSVSDFGEQAIEKAVRELARIYSALSLADSFLVGLEAPPVEAGFTAQAHAKFVEAINDDFNTSEAMAAIFELIRHFNSQVKRGMKANAAVIGKCAALREFIRGVGKQMALFQESPHNFLQTLDDMLLTKMKLERTQVQKLVDERWQAKTAKDFQRADLLRDELLKMGIAVMDAPGGSIWEVSK